MRVLRRTTETKNGLLYFAGELLSGVVFELEDGNWISAEQYVVGGEVIPDRKLYAPKSGIVISEGEVLGVMQLEGTPFTGRAHWFDDLGRLTTRIDYEFGTANWKTLRRWHPSGILAENGELLPGLAFRWYESGCTARIQGMGITAEYSEAGGLTSLVLATQCDLTYLYKIYLEPRKDLILSGSPFRDNHIPLLGDFSQLKTLTLEETSITTYGLQAFNVCELHSLTTRSNAYLKQSEIADFVSRQVNCEWKSRDL